MSQRENSAPGETPAPGSDESTPGVPHTGAGAGTALDAMLRTRQMRPRRDAQPDPEPPPPTPNADQAAPPDA